MLTFRGVAAVVNIPSVPVLSAPMRWANNAFLPVLFLLATVLSGQALLPRAHRTDVYLTALGGLLTIVYMIGLVFRRQRQYAS